MAKCFGQKVGSDCVNQGAGGGGDQLHKTREHVCGQVVPLLQ